MCVCVCGGGGVEAPIRTKSFSFPCCAWIWEILDPQLKPKVKNNKDVKEKKYRT